jgi:hypothetical protein
MLEKSLHFPIKPGVVAAWDTRTVVIIALLDGSCTRVRDVATGEQHDVPVEELHGIPAIGQIESNERRWALLRDSTRAEWKQARRRERVLKRCILRDGDSSGGVDFACKALDRSRRTIYRLLANYRAAAQTTRNTPGHPLRADAYLPLAKLLRCAASNNAFSVGPERPSRWSWRKSKDNVAQPA